MLRSIYHIHVSEREGEKECERDSQRCHKALRQPATFGLCRNLLFHARVAPIIYKHFASRQEGEREAERERGGVAALCCCWAWPTRAD